MCRRCEKCPEKDVELMQKNIDLMDTKKGGEEVNDEIIRAGYEYSIAAFEDELRRESELNNSLNFNLMILGFIFAGLATLLSTKGCNDNSKIFFIISTIVLGINLIILLITFLYRKKHYFPSAVDCVNEMYDRYLNDEDFKEFNKDKATLMEANFIMTDHPIVNEVISQNSVKRNLLTISVILTALTIIFFVIGVILLW